MVEFVLVGLVNALANVDGKAQHGKIAGFDLQAPVECRRVRGLLDHRLNALAHHGGDIVARHPHEHEQVPHQRRARDNEARARTIDQADHRRRQTLDIAAPQTEHEVMRQTRQGMGQSLAGMADRIEAQLAGKIGKLATQTGNTIRRCDQRGAGPDTGVDR